MQMFYFILSELFRPFNKSISNDFYLKAYKAGLKKRK